MSRRVFAAVVVCAVMFTGCGAHGSGNSWAPVTSVTPDTPELDTATAQRLDDTIKDVMEWAQVPGAVVGVWSPSAHYVRAMGVANTSNNEPMRTDFYQRIGSVTKTFTVTALLQLADQGLLRLDDPIGKYVDGVPNGDRITLRQLAGMRSGLFNYSMSLRFAHDVGIDRQRTFTDEQLLNYSFLQLPVSAPGEKFEYNNTNAILLAQVVKKVSGQLLPDFVRERITRPLGLNHTSFPGTNLYPEPHARGYTKAPGGPIVDSTDWSPSWASAAGAMVSTLDDMRIWADALATGKLLSPEMQKQRLQTLPMSPLPDDIRYGLGIFDSRGWLGHGGSIGGYQTMIIHSPAEKTTVVVMINTDVTRVPAYPSTLFATAITKVITPQHVFELENSVTHPEKPR